jgi:hypothetical protein
VTYYIYETLIMSRSRTTFSTLMGDRVACVVLPWLIYGMRLPGVWIADQTWYGW